VKAIEIDPSLSEAHNALASVMSSYDWKFADAEAEWRKAIALNPNYASAHQWYAEHLHSMGRKTEALAEMRTAQELDPLSLIINGLLAQMYNANGQTEQALEQLKKTLEIDPNFPRTHLFLAEVYQSQAKYEDAADEFNESFRLSGGPPDKAAQFALKIKNAYKRGGPKAYSRTIAEVLDSRSGPGSGAPSVVVAGYWADAGETERAFAVLEKAYEQHDDSMLMLKAPRLDRIKSDPRYLELIRKVGLPE
jgi:tetratricopeptide (TPR) repeat protein